MALDRCPLGGEARERPERSTTEIGNRDRQINMEILITSL